MQSTYGRTYDKVKAFFSHDDIRITLFNILALGGIFVCVATSIHDFLYVSLQSFIVDIVLLVLSVTLLLYSQRTGNYQRCYFLTIFFVFLLGFPYLFFMSNGYHGGMPLVFVFAIIFTVLMLDKKLAIIVSLFEICLYSTLFFIAYYYPQTVHYFGSEFVRMIDILIAMILCSVVCGACIYLHLRKYEEQKEILAKQNKQLHVYNNAKSTFLTTVAHEIRNPLTAISVNTRDTKELLEYDAQEKELINKNLETVENIIFRIDNILTDLMDTVSVEQGRFQLRKEEIYLKDVLQEAVNMYLGDMKLKNTIVHLDAPDIGPIMADPARLLQVMINLLSNALKYTNNGCISVTLEDKEAFQLVSVADSGEGMDESVLQEVFKGYVSLSKEYWRHGIGLYVCHQIINAHGGDISIKSHKGQGTCIVFSLPK